MSAGSEAEAHSDPGSITEGLLILKKVLNPSEPQVPHQKMWILMMVTHRVIVTFKYVRRASMVPNAYK